MPRKKTFVSPPIQRNLSLSTCLLIVFVVFSVNADQGGENENEDAMFSGNTKRRPKLSLAFVDSNQKKAFYNILAAKHYFSPFNSFTKFLPPRSYGNQNAPTHSPLDHWLKHFQNTESSIPNRKRLQFK